MFKFIKKHTDDRVKKLKTRVIELESENEKLQVELFRYHLKVGKIKPARRRPLMKVMGNTGSSGPR